MANFRYKARDKFGKPASGVMSGADKGSIATHLNAMGYIPISIDEVKDAGGPSLNIMDIFNRISPADINVFTRQLHTLQKAGIPLLLSLDIVEKQTKSGRFKDIIKEIMMHIEHGLSLSGALEKYPAIFNEFYVNMVKAGEASGLLDEVLARLVEFGEKEEDNRSKIKSATRYPLITLGALAMAFMVVVTFVIPKFAAIFSQFKTELPLPTRILLGLNFVIQHYWYIIIAASAGAVFLFLKYINTKSGRFQWDYFKLHMPVFGPLALMLTMARFTRTMSILMRSGLPILQVLDMASRTAGNSVVARAVDNIASSVREGKGISEPMRISGIFPPMVVNMVAIGEDTGKVDELLMSVSEYYDQQADYMIKNFTTILEPLFVLVLGVMVLVMALAIFLPMWNMINLFRR